MNKPIFGQLLEEVELINNLPRPIYDTITYFESKPERYSVEGLFRVCGDKKQIDLLKTKYNEREPIEIEEINIHVITSVFKLYLRELPDSLVTDEYTELMLMFVQLNEYDKEAVVKKFKNVLEDVPEVYYIVLKSVIEFLVKISKESESNKMTSKNLSLIFGPTIFNHQDIEDMLRADNPATICTQYFIDNYDIIFNNE